MRYFLPFMLFFIGTGCISTNVDTGPTIQDAANQESASSPTTAQIDIPEELIFTPPEGAMEGPGTYGPWNNRLMSAVSEDGVTWEKTGLVITDQADVPDLAIVDGVVYLYYTGWTTSKGETNKTVVAISEDQGYSWTHVQLDLEGFEKMSPPVDPDIQYVDGTFRLFLTSDPNDGDGPRTYYAESNDGIHFEKKGVAYEQAGERVLDPSIILIGNTWYYFAGGGPGNWRGVSEDGKVFTDLSPDNFFADGKAHMMSNGIQVGDEYRYWAFSNQGTDIVSFTTQDGDQWEYDGIALALDEDSTKEAHQVKDASVIQLSNGTYLMVYVTGIPE